MKTQLLYFILLIGNPAYVIAGTDDRKNAIRDCGGHQLEMKQENTEGLYQNTQDNCEELLSGRFSKYSYDILKKPNYA
jgi:hypothetical protein